MVQYVGKYLRCVCLPLVVLSSQLTAGPVARQSVVSLVSQADTIVTGSAQAVMINGAVDITINVERVLKGSTKPGALVSVQWTPPNQGHPIPSNAGSPWKAHGVFYLRATTTGGWSVVSASGGDIGWANTFEETPATVPDDIRAAVTASVPVNATALDAVFAELVAGTESGSPAMTDLVAEFRQAKSPVLNAAFHRFSSKADGPLMNLGLRGLVPSGDSAAIVATGQQYKTLAGKPGWANLLQEIKVYYQTIDPQALRTLGMLATDATLPSEVRVAMATALARMHTQDTLKYLAQLLDDPSSAVVTAAVGGLASFANNVPIGSHEPAAGDWKYRTDQTIAHSVFDDGAIAVRGPYYVSFWKSWWQQYGTELSQ